LNESAFFYLPEWMRKYALRLFFLLLGKDTMFRNLLSMQPGKKSEAIKQDPAF